MAIKTINANTLKSWLDNGEAILVDVREPAEYAAERIPGAKLLPLAKISKAALPEIANKKLVVHCKAGKRGSAACEKLLAEAPEIEIYNLEGGISSWTAAGFDVKSSDKFFLPLDRQLQLTIGTSVLIGTILGYTLNPAFYLVPGFLGLGLINAGLTGWCGMALLLAKMPWNQKTS